MEKTIQEGLTVWAVALTLIKQGYSQSEVNTGCFSYWAASKDEALGLAIQNKSIVDLMNRGYSLAGNAVLEIVTTPPNPGIDQSSQSEVG